MLECREIGLFLVKIDAYNTNLKHFQRFFLKMAEKIFP